MRRLHRYLTGPRPHHRRNWRRLWRYCRCGFRWRCPDSAELVPMPYAPKVPPLDRATYRAVVRATAPVVAVPAPMVAVPAPMVVAPDNPPPPARHRARNVRNPLWNSPSGRHEIGRAGALTPGQFARARRAERAGQA